jgi:hypothetical protein
MWLCFRVYIHFAIDWHCQIWSFLSTTLLSSLPARDTYHHWYPTIYLIEPHSANANELRYGVLRRIYYDYCQKQHVYYCLGCILPA